MPLILSTGKQNLLGFPTTWPKSGQASALHAPRARDCGPGPGSAGTSPGSERPWDPLRRPKPPAISDPEKQNTPTPAQRKGPRAPPTMLFYRRKDPLSAERGENGLYHRPPRARETPPCGGRAKCPGISCGAGLQAEEDWAARVRPLRSRSFVRPVLSTEKVLSSVDSRSTFQCQQHVVSAELHV